MNILLVSRCPPFPIYFGDRLIVYHLAQELSARRHHIDLLAFCDRPEEAANIPRYERFFRYIKLVQKPATSPLGYLGRLGGGFFPGRAAAAWSPEMWRAIEERLRVGAYDLVQLFGGVQVYEYRALVRALPNIIVPYESYSLYLKNALAAEGNAPRRLRMRLQAVVARQYERRMFAGFERVIVLTASDAAALRELDPTLTPTIIPNGVDTDYFVATEFEPAEPTLIFTGNFEYEPNLEAALRLVKSIFPMVRSRVPGAKLLLVGYKPPLALLNAARADVEIVGSVPDMRPYLERALIYVSPLVKGAGIKNKLLEAMAMQKPLVATPLSMEGIAARNGEHVLLAESDDEFARAIVKLVKDKTLRRRLAANARALIDHQYTWKHVAAQYEALYKQLAGHSDRKP